MNLSPLLLNTYGSLFIFPALSPSSQNPRKSCLADKAFGKVFCDILMWNCLYHWHQSVYNISKIQRGTVGITAIDIGLASWMPAECIECRLYMPLYFSLSWNVLGRVPNVRYIKYDQFSVFLGHCIFQAIFLHIILDVVSHALLHVHGHMKGRFTDL